MKLEFSFKDVTDNISRSIDLSKNTVIYGNNGRGKTRILSAINTLHEIADIDLRPAVLQMVEELNIEQLKIDTYDLSELFRRRGNNGDEEKFRKFLRANEYPLRDFYGSVLMISQFSSLFSEIMNKYITHLKNFIDYLNGDKQKIPKYYLSFRSFENLLRESQFSLRRIRNEIVHTQHFNPAVEDLMPYVQDALSANDYLVRWLEKSRYDNVNVQSDRLIEIKSELTKALKSTNTTYISPSTNLEKVKKTLDDMITDNVEKYGQTFFENHEVSTKTKSMIGQRFQNIVDGLQIVNELLESGYGGLKIIVKNRKISYQKKNDSKFVDLPIDRLSSGEKRIIKLFLSVQFYDADIILIDEPEVSLSLNFQSKLINDLLLLAGKTGKKMILATHAPFIFEDCITNKFERLEL